MTYQAGDTGYGYVWLEELDGTPIVFADYAAFTAAGWTAVHEVNGATDASPGITLTHIGTVGQWDEGFYRLTVSVDAGYGVAILRPPTGDLDRHAVSAVVVIGHADVYSLDDVMARLIAIAGQPVVPDRETTYDIEIAEGAALYQAITIPEANLAPIDETDLTDATITVQAAIRSVEQGANSQFDTTPAAADDEILAIITDAANRIIELSYPVMPTRLALGAETAGGDVAQVDSKTFAWDLDVSVVKSFAITAVAPGLSGTFTVAGDQRRWLRKGQIVAVTGSTGNDANWTVASVALVSGATVITVTGTIPGATVDGNVEATVSCRPVRGAFVVTRQEHR